MTDEDSAMSAEDSQPELVDLTGRSSTLIRIVNWLQDEGYETVLSPDSDDVWSWVLETRYAPAPLTDDRLVDVHILAQEYLEKITLLLPILLSDSDVNTHPDPNQIYMSLRNMAIFNESNIDIETGETGEVFLLISKDIYFDAQLTRDLMMRSLRRMYNQYVVTTMNVPSNGDATQADQQ